MVDEMKGMLETNGSPSETVQKIPQLRSRQIQVLTSSEHAPGQNVAAALLDGLF